MKKPSALLLALALCLSLCACGNTASQPSGEVSESPTSSDAAASASPAVEADLSLPVFEYASGLKNSDTAITVNGVPLPMDLYCYWLSSYCYYIDSFYMSYGMTADFTSEEKAETMKDYVRRVLVYYTMVQDLCDQNNVSLSQEQIDEFHSSLTETAVSADIDRDELLRQYGLSEDDLLRMSLAPDLRDSLMDVLVEPNEEDLARYLSDIHAFHCKHILIKTTDADKKDANGSVTQTAEQYNAEKKALAEDLLARLRAAADPEPLLDEMAEAYSEDGRDSLGHLLAPDGYTFSDDNSLVDGFREATLAVEPGQLTGIVETSYGYHIILRLPLDTGEFMDDYKDATLEAILEAEVERADVVLSDAVQALDVADFYDRYVAWQTAWADEFVPDLAGG